MSAILYTNPFGKAVRRHSYSGGNDFRKCPRYYQLTRIDGWKRKDKSAAMEFGNCVEAAIQYHIENGGSGGVEKFRQLWKVFEDNKGLTYTEKEDSWEALNRAGAEMLELFIVKLPSLPIRNPKFQLNYEKEPMPGTELAGITDTAYVDILSFPENLPPLVIDIKTTGTTPPEPEDLCLDEQLREYAWITGHPHVAFLWFQKMKPDGYKKGVAVTFLQDAGIFKAGEPGYVLLAEEGDLYVSSFETYSSYDKDSKDDMGDTLKGKALTAVKEKYKKWSTVVQVDATQVTRQRMFFLQTTLSETEVLDTGELIAQDIANIVWANNRGKFPQRCGVRFPNNPCISCDCRGICNGNNTLRDEKLIKIGPAQEDDWLAELEK